MDCAHASKLFKIESLRMGNKVDITEKTEKRFFEYIFAKIRKIKVSDARTYMVTWLDRTSHFSYKKLIYYTKMKAEIIIHWKEI